MGSLGGLVDPSLGKTVFLISKKMNDICYIGTTHILKSPRGCPVEGGGVHRNGGMGASAPINNLLKLYKI